MSYAISKNSDSKVYHRIHCKYVKQIKDGNKSINKRDLTEFEKLGYRPCKYCFTIDFKYYREIKGINSFIGDANIKHKLIGKDLIILTEIGYWKISYSSECNAYVLYHGNYYPDDENPERYTTSEYHLQEDAGQSQAIMKFIKYIKGHDIFRQRQLDNIENLSKKTQKQKKMYKKLRKKRTYYMAANTLRLISVLQTSKERNH